MELKISEEAITRNLLNKIRTISEGYETAENMNKKEVVIGKDDPKYSEFINNITKFVGAIKTDEKSLIVYPEQGDVIFNGAITDMNNLKFQFRYNDQSGGLYIWADSMLLTKEVTDKLSKLVIIKDQWKDYWSNNINQY